MNDQAKVQALWTALAPLYRKAERIALEWDSYSEQKRRLTDIRVLAGPLAARSGNRAEVLQIDAILSRESALYESTAAVLKELKKTLPLLSIRRLRECLYPRRLRATCETIASAVEDLRSVMPPPPDWPGPTTAEDSFLVADSKIDQLEANVEKMEHHQRAVDETERKRFERAEAERKAEVEVKAPKLAPVPADNSKRGRGRNLTKLNERIDNFVNQGMQDEEIETAAMSRAQEQTQEQTGKPLSGPAKARTLKAVRQAISRSRKKKGTEIPHNSK
jgi:hypothetical protein